MRKRVAVRQLNRPRDRRTQLCRNLLAALIMEGEVRTTSARAHEIRSRLDHLVTLAKRGDLHARRLALSRLPHPPAVQQLFGELAERYRERQGGYTRALRLGTRRGDGAELMLVQLVE